MSTDSAQTYDEYKERQQAWQGNMSHEEISRIMAQRSEGMIDLNNLPPQEHNWVDRGVVASCEGAGHPNHRYYKRT